MTSWNPAIASSFLPEQIERLRLSVHPSGRVAAGLHRGKTEDAPGNCSEFGVGVPFNQGMPKRVGTFNAIRSVAGTHFGKREHRPRSAAAFGYSFRTLVVPDAGRIKGFERQEVERRKLRHGHSKPAFDRVPRQPLRRGDGHRRRRLEAVGARPGGVAGGR